MPDLSMVAVQLRISIARVERPAHYRQWISEAAERAADASAGATHRLFVFPEDVGHFVPLAFSPAAADAATVDEAFAALAVRSPLAMLRGAVSARSLDLKRAALTAFLPRSESLVRETFATVARRCGATVVSGSHLRVGPGGRITNSSCAFDPSGRLLAVTDKVNLVPGLEDGAPGGLNLSRGDPDQLPVVSAPWGKLATLICYDGFAMAHTATERFADVGRRVDARGADVVANPAANPWPWLGPWHFASAGDTRRRDEQWRQEGLRRSLAVARHTRWGITAHLCGTILDRQFEGRSEILQRDDGDVTVLARARTHTEAEIVSARIPLPFD